MYYIYQRISTQMQSLLRQEGLISEYCKEHNIEVPEENIFSDVITGKTIKRENYQKLKALLTKDSILIIQSLDRLGRNWDLIKNEWQELTKKGVYIIVIDCPLINVLPDKNGEVSIDRRLIQEMMFTLLCYVSQKEVEKVSIRTRDGIRARRESDPNFRIGRPKIHSTDKYDRVVELYEQGNTMEQVASMTGMSRATVSRILAKKRRKG